MAPKEETIGQVKQRHKLELRALQNEVKAFQKKAKKDRMTKAELEAAVRDMEAAVARRHEEELLAFEAESTEPDEATEPATAAAAVAEPAAASVPPQPSKAQRRREKQKQAERERRERIDEANRHVVSERQVEADAILARLARHGLAIKDIPSDGHCMYHAVADQLARHGSPVVESPAFLHLRRLTSSYLRAHPDDFAPFLALEPQPDKSLDELFAAYCDRVAETADWGGQLELRALACALQRPIEVFAAEGGELTMGGEFARAGGPEPLQLTYHLHYYALGEHFNSVAPLP